MNIIKLYLSTLVVISLFFLTGCPEQEKTTAQLKTEVLNKAGECSTELKRDYENKIEQQEKILNNDKKLKKSLKNMLSLIKC